MGGSFFSIHSFLFLCFVFLFKCKTNKITRNYFHHGYVHLAIPGTRFTPSIEDTFGFPKDLSHFCLFVCLFVCFCLFVCLFVCFFLFVCLFCFVFWWWWGNSQNNNHLYGSNGKEKWEFARFFLLRKQWDICLLF